MNSLDTDSLSLAGAFLIGAVFATIAVIRIVKAVMQLFDEGPYRPSRPPWRRHIDHDNNKEDDQ